MSYDDLSKKYDVKAETIERNHLQAINHIREILGEKPIPITKRVKKVCKVNNLYKRFVK